MVIWDKFLLYLVLRVPSASDSSPKKKSASGKIQLNKKKIISGDA
jgi:hypothetical protein